MLVFEGSGRAEMRSTLACVSVLTRWDSLEYFYEI